MQKADPTQSFRTHNKMAAYYGNILINDYGVVPEFKSYDERFKNNNKLKEFFYSDQDNWNMQISRHIPSDIMIRNPKHIQIDVKITNTIDIPEYCVYWYYYLKYKIPTIMIRRDKENKINDKAFMIGYNAPLTPENINVIWHHDEFYIIQMILEIFPNITTMIRAKDSPDRLSNHMFLWAFNDFWEEIPTTPINIFDFIFKKHDDLNFFWNK